MVLALTALVAAPPAAHAHGDEGEMTVTVTEPAADGSVVLEVGILFENDQELAEEAVVTAVLTGPDGTAVGPVEVPHTEGARYAATVTGLAVGDWTVEFTSVEPVSAATASFQIPAAAAETTAAAAVETTAAPTDTPVSAQDTVTDTKPLVIAPAPTAGDAGNDTENDDEGGSGANLVVIGLLAAAAVGVGVVVWRKSSAPR